MNEPLDIYQIRKSTKKVVNRPEWLKEKGFFYSKRYQRKFQVTGIEDTPSAFESTTDNNSKFSK